MGTGTNHDEIKIDFQELEQLLTHITSLQLIFEEKINPNIEKLVAEDYYKGGTAYKAMEHYPKMLNKALEVRDLYYRAIQDISEMIDKWLEADEALQNQIINSIQNGSKLGKNIQMLSKHANGES